MKYQYFVSFAMNNEAGGGFGNNVVTATRPITGESDVREMERAIKERMGLRDITILHWRRFEEEEPST